MKEVVSKAAAKRLARLAVIVLGGSLLALVALALTVPAAPSWLSGNPVETGAVLVLAGLALSVEVPPGFWARRGRPAS